MEPLVESAVRITVLAGAVAVLLRVFRITSPSLAHQAWTGVVVLMLLLPFVVLWGPEAPIPVLPEPPSLGATPPLSSGTAWEGTHAPVPIRPANGQQPPVDWAMVVALLYATGVAVLLLRLGLGIRRARRLVREAIPIDGHLTHPQCVTPVTVGFFATRVILPPSWVKWSEAELAAVVEHEQEHARRRDPLVTFVALVNRALFWFHPLAWWLPRQVSRLSEQACDAMVLSRGHDAELYARSLIRFARATAESHGRVSPVGTAMPGVGLQTRLRLLTDTPTARPSLMRRACTAAAYAAAVAACSLTIPTASAREAPEPALAPNQQAAASEWSMQATEHFEIFYQRSQEPRLADVREAAEQAYAQVSGQLKYEVTQRVRLVLVGRDRDWRTVVGPQALAAASGAPSRQVIVLTLESLDMHPGIIVHELTHQFAFEIIPQTSRAAPWIAEGLARHQRGVWEDAERQSARDAVAAGRLPALDRLLDAEPYWSHALFDFIAAEYGAEGIRRYLFALRTRANDAISVAFGVTLGEFDNAFRRYLTTRFGQP